MTTATRSKAAAQSNGAVDVLSEDQRNEQALLLTLAELGGRRVQEESLKHYGKELVLPEAMSPNDAIDYLKDYIAMQEQETRFQRVFRYRPWDGAHALQSALVKVFGMAGVQKPIMTFFGPRKPELISVNVGPNQSIQVPWGRMGAPMFGEEANIYTSEEQHPEYGALFQLIVDAPRKYRAHIEGLFRVIEEELRTNSIYKAKAIDGQPQAEFLDLSGVDPSKVIYSDEVLVQLGANVWSLLRHSEQMRQLGIPLKRANLLEGPYGTGKTLAAFLTAKEAVENGWTFIYCRPGKDKLDEVLATARLYQPAVVFFEDVDVLAEDGSPDSVTRLLDMFDGITAKGTELMVVLTTNHVERIHKGMVRPGRLDSVIHIGALDEHGVQRMIEATVPETLRERDLDYSLIYAAMEGFLPAFVKEAIDRTLRYAISRNDGETGVLLTEDFVQAANGLQPQLELMEGAKEGVRRPTIDAAMERVAIEAAHTVIESTVIDTDEPRWKLVPEESDELVKA